MKRLSLLLTFIAGINSFTGAQESLRFWGWEDDENYLIHKAGNTYLVNAKTGTETIKENHEDYQEREFYIFQKEGHLYYKGSKEEKERQLTKEEQQTSNPTLSPDRKQVAFTRNKNLYVIDITTGSERQLTRDGGALIYNGWASWVYYEEILGRRSRYRAFYWSEDSKKIAFLRFDDSPVPEFPIFHHEGSDPVHGMLEETRYPKSGDPNPKVSLGIAHLETDEITWVETDKDMEYTAWVFWTPDSKRLLFQQLNRDQDTLKMFSADPVSGQSKLIHEEVQPTWVEFYEEIHFLDDEKRFLLKSDRDGWSNIYLHDLNGSPPINLTNADWRVKSILHIDEDKDQLFVLGTGKNPTDQHLFLTDFSGKPMRQLTSGEGWHSPALSAEGSYFVDSYSSFNNPGEKNLHNLKGKKIRTIIGQADNPNMAGNIKAELFTIPTSDGFNLPAYWVLPANFDKNKKYPVVFRIYGGPDAGTVYNRFNSFSYDPMVREGVIIFSVDHRGSGKFGKKGLDYMHRNLGKWEMNDYIEAVKWLRQHPFIDANKVGIQGSSYGGYMAAMALTYASDYFTHGIASASVTDWRLYDNIYTERYMDTPQANPEGYEQGAVMSHASKLKGKLLIIHGTVDDNVHLQQSIQLISKLQEEGKDFEMMVYPGGRHGWGGNKRIHSRNLSRNFWRKHGFGKANEIKP